MHREDVRLQDPTLRMKGTPEMFFQYRSQKEAFTFLREILADKRGIGSLHGPGSSGKSTLLRHFFHELPADLSVAVVDGARLKAPEFVTAVLEQFGYEVSLASADELLNMLRVIVGQQSRNRQATVLVLKNINHMYPSTLGVLDKLAGLTFQSRYALRILLVSDRSIRGMIDSPGLQNLANRWVGDFELGPLTSKESLAYLYDKLRSYGSAQPDSIFPVDVCDKLHLASGGLPGELDGIAMSALDGDADSPVLLEYVESPAVNEELRSLKKATEADSMSMVHEPATLIITLNGEILQEIEVNSEKVLIGRSPISDVSIRHDFVSKHHALLMKSGDALLLVDLNSRNGTFVNSKRITSKALRHEDIISVGDHRIKVIDPSTRSRPLLDDLDIASTADTAAMKNIDDMRREKAARVVRRTNVPRTGNALD